MKLRYVLIPLFLYTGLFNTLYGAHITDSINDNVLTRAANVGIGDQVLQNSTGSNDNVAIGYAAMKNSSSSSNQNVAVGFGAMQNATGSVNVALGWLASQNAKASNTNVAIGRAPLFNSLNSSVNVAIGNLAMRDVTGSNVNIAIGDLTMVRAQNAFNDIAIGLQALERNVYTIINPYGGSNVAIGVWAMRNPLDSNFNVAIGNQALQNATGANFNTVVGNQAMEKSNTGARDNCAFGNFALQAVLSGVAINNIAIGKAAMEFSTGPISNVAIGNGALAFNSNATGNIAIGTLAQQQSTNVLQNISLGTQSMQFSNSGTKNVAIGFNAMANANNVTNNIAIGDSAMQTALNANNNIAMGSAALRNNISGTNNIAIGTLAGSKLVSNESDDIYIGNKGVAKETKTIRIGENQSRCFITGIRGVATAFVDATPVVIDSAGQLGTISSSIKYKQDISDIDAEHNKKMLKLRPVTFNYKGDAKNTPQFGLIAEEVDEVYPELVIHDGNGEAYTVNYMALIPLLLKQIQELEMQVLEQKQYNLEQDEHMQLLDAQVNELRTLVAQLTAIIIK